MYNVFFYKDKNGKSEIEEYLLKLQKKKLKKQKDIYKILKRGVIMMENKPYTSWKEIRKELAISPEQEAEIQLERDIIEAIIEARKKNKLTQRELSEKSGIKQPVIARIEKYANSPQTNTLIKLLYPMGYTIRVVPLEEAEATE